MSKRMLFDTSLPSHEEMLRLRLEAHKARSEAVRHFLTALFPRTDLARTIGRDELHQRRPDPVCERC